MASRARLGCAAATRSRASTAVTPVAPANNGLMSSSRISGWSKASWATRIKISATPSLAAAGRPRYPCKSRHTRVRHHRVPQRLIERRQCERGIPDLFDRRTAVAEHHYRTEYRVLDNPDDQFDRAGELSHLLHEKPVKPRVGADARDAVSIDRASLLTRSGASRSSATPPTSPLCVRLGKRILSATGCPISAAAAAAPSASATS